jgi:hypothetical protein
VPEPHAGAGAEFEAERLYARLLERLGVGDIKCPPCARVLLPEPFNWESYTFTATGGQSWTWDIRCARALVSRGPAARRLPLSPEGVHIWLQSHGHVDERHLGHIPLDRLSEPVLLAPVPDGRGHVMIDGSHRATIRMRAGIPVDGYLLTDIENALAIGTVPLAMPRVADELRRQQLLRDDLGR